MNRSLFSKEDLTATAQSDQPLQTLAFRQTGDPWHDWGICELHEVLQSVAAHDERVHLSEPDAAGFTVAAAMAEDEFARLLHEEMASSARWNELYPRFEEGKKIPGCGPKVEAGRRVPGSNDKNDPKFVKENWEARECKGNPPQQARNKCQRITNVPLTPKVLNTLLSLEGGDKSFEGLAAAALAATDADLKQEANPLTANHHSNGKVRGPFGSNSARVEAGLFVLSCYAASLSAWKPFVTVPPSGCTVYLPDNVPFDRALRLWKHLHTKALRHPDEEGGTMYRNLPLSGDGEKMQLLVLLDALQSTVPVRREPDDLGEDDIIELNNWITISFSSGTGVNVGSVHRIEVPSEVFHYLAPIEPPERWKNQARLAFVPDCLAAIEVRKSKDSQENLPIQNRFAHALFQNGSEERWRLFESCTLYLYKNTERAIESRKRMSDKRKTRFDIASSLLSHFMNHFAKEMNLMQEEQLNACRKIGELAGQAFSRDVTMISRLHNASSPDELRANLSLLSFRLFKASNDAEDRRDLYHISAQEFQKVLDMVSGPDWAKAAQTISLFACLKAFNRNLGEGGNANTSGGTT